MGYNLTAKLSKPFAVISASRIGILLRRISKVTGQVKATNKTILNGLKMRLDGAKRRWVEKLPNAL